MKQLEIIGKQNQKLSLQDNDNTPIELYIRKLSEILTTKNIIILHTTSSSLLIRPSDIFSIEVKTKEESNIPQDSPEIEEKKVELPEDMITDMT
jgi:hypothetical protein